MRSAAAAPHVFWAILFIVLPLVIVVFYAFTDANGNFSFSNITSLGDYLPIFWLSLELAIIATAICLVIGYPLAYIIAKAKPKNQKFFIVSDYIMASDNTKRNTFTQNWHMLPAANIYISVLKLYAVIVSVHGFLFRFDRTDGAFAFSAEFGDCRAEYNSVSSFFRNSDAIFLPCHIGEIAKRNNFVSALISSDIADNGVCTVVADYPVEAFPCVIIFPERSVVIIECIE